ncbi:PHP domain-containing protein [Arthrobacter silvisoli]|uniref:PHP domain-containing protein n=1 Tax=Arthrobacter silvisoli TaxID=2291022 RepID=UPI000E212F08|nr:PHP domain-containing protein [Arthrobacter silvisoli]
MKIDLHAHSNVSDGTESPGELIRSAAAAGLDVVALTDHDSTDGWEQASVAAVEHGVALVPGMEISCRTAEGISVHLLSYLHDPAHPGLLEEITKSKDARLTRAQRMVSLLAEDYPLSWDDVIHHVAPGATVGRPHIADALVAAGAVADRTEAFTAILSARSRYFVQHYAPEPAFAVELVRAAGGVPVFAHPVASARGRVVGERTYRDMVDAGLLGLEVEHRDNPEAGRAFLRRFAAENGLFMTGSSDYHGAGKVNLLGENVTSPAVLARIEELGTGCRIVRA